MSSNAKQQQFKRQFQTAFILFFYRKTPLISSLQQTLLPSFADLLRH